MSEPWGDPSRGISSGDALIRPERHPASRRREAQLGSCTERENLVAMPRVRILSGVARLITNHLHLAIFESAPEVRVLCSAGITRLRRSYDPVRHPTWPSPYATLRPLPSPTTGLPRLPEPPFRRAVPTTPADRAGARVDCFPARAAFPKWQEGRHPHCHYRGLLRLHACYGPPDRSAAQGGLCREAPTRPVTRPNRSPASGPIVNYPGEILPH